MSKLIFSLLLLGCNLGYSISITDSLYPVRVTFFTSLMSERYFFGHIEAEIIDINTLPQSFKTQYNFQETPENGGDHYYVNYWPSGNKETELNPTKEYKGVEIIVIYLNESQLRTFIQKANKLASEISDYILGDYKKGYNILRNNCADALSQALGLNPDNYKSLGITIPAYVYKGIVNSFTQIR